MGLEHEVQLLGRALETLVVPGKFTQVCMNTLPADAKCIFEQMIGIRSKPAQPRMEASAQDEGEEVGSDEADGEGGGDGDDDGDGDQSNASGIAESPRAPQAASGSGGPADSSASVQPTAEPSSEGVTN